MPLPDEPPGATVPVDVADTAESMFKFEPVSVLIVPEFVVFDVKAPFNAGILAEPYAIGSVPPPLIFESDPDPVPTIADDKTLVTILVPVANF
jgi:hypothetical protein